MKEIAQLLTTAFIFGDKEQMYKANGIINEKCKLKDDIPEELNKFESPIHYANHCFHKSRGEYEREERAVLSALEQTIEFK